MSGETERLTGRELDAAIDERVFGKTIEFREKRPYTFDDRQYFSYSTPYFHKDMAAAWQVAEWIREQTGVFILEWNGFEWEVFYGKDDYNYLPPANAATPSEAICHAALALADRLEREESCLT